MLNFLKKYRLCAIAVTTAILIGSSYFSYDLGSKVSGLSLLKEGLSTCTGRLTQTYTAKMMGSGGQYLSGAFVTATEECLADVKGMMAASSIKAISSSAKKLGTLISSAYWLHKEFTASNLIEGQFTNERFEKVEAIRLELEESIAIALASLTGALNFQKLNLAVISTLIFVLMGWEITNRRKKRLTNELIELTARDYTQNGVIGVKAKRLIVDALESNELEECSKLFSAIDIRDQRLEKLRGNDELEIVCEIEPNLEFEVMCEIEANLEVEFEAEEDLLCDDSVWTDQFGTEDYNTDLVGLRDAGSVPFPQKNDVIEVQGFSTDIETIFNRVVDLFQERLTESHVLIDVRGDVKLSANISVENLTQGLHSLLSYSLKRFGDCSNSKIVCFIKEQQGMAQISYMDNGAPLDFESIDLAIAREIFEENGATITMENSDDFGGHINLLMEKGISDKSEKRLVSVKKTTKRELMRSLGL